MKLPVLLLPIALVLLSACGGKAQSPYTGYIGSKHYDQYICLTVPEDGEIEAYNLTSSKDNFKSTYSPVGEDPIAVYRPGVCFLARFDKGYIYSFNYQLEGDWYHFRFLVDQNGKTTILNAS
ncbi:hypothetical protein [Pseudescherichia vulneris]|mgnify:FL=1|uniref:hypothetical protein n=1 Tax=Pseudescherichia vulneris TaxID=566 RepID=UPI0012AC2B40|nr:hypothetical protein [Pseudescherichia vulneris]MDU5452490.1 hypothetical protein [Pseudescherichia vulneris]